MAKAIERMPSKFELSVALQVGRIVGVEGVGDGALIAAFEGVSSGGLIRMEHLTSAAKLLTTADLLVTEAEGWKIRGALAALADLPNDEGCAALAVLILSVAPPLWLASATGGALINIDLIPGDEWKSVCDNIGDASRRESTLLALGRKIHDRGLLADFSKRAVEAVLAACRRSLVELERADLATKVHNVHGREHLGYHVICPSISGRPWRLTVLSGWSGLSEVVTMINRHDVGIEADAKDRAFVICAPAPASDDHARIIGWCTGAVIYSHLPDDLTGRGEWSSARLFINVLDLEPLLPDLQAGPS